MFNINKDKIAKMKYNSNTAQYAEICDILIEKALDKDGRVSMLSDLAAKEYINDKYTLFSIYGLISKILLRNLRIAETSNKISTNKKNVKERAILAYKWLKLANSILGFNTDYIINILQLDLQYTVLENKERESVLEDQEIKNLTKIYKKLFNLCQQINRETDILNSAPGVISTRKIHGE